MAPRAKPVVGLPRTSKTLLQAGLKRGGGVTMEGCGEHAVVIGASMGGLLAARALADVFPLVSVLERDSFPEADIPG